MLRTLTKRLAHLYPEGEARAIVLLLLDECFDLSMTDAYCGGIEGLNDDDRQRLESMMSRLEQAEPVQYVIGHAWFCGRRFDVSHGVLIPRPETEQLCRMSVDGLPADAQVLDIGTGSGCIAITIALDAPTAHVTAWDLSPEALDVARRNAVLLGADVIIEKSDALHLSQEHERWDVIVSNPPYVRRSEAKSMSRHVTGHEPHMALFVDDDDALCFYRSIASYSLTALKHGGRLLFEANTALAADTAALLDGMGLAGATVLDDEFGLPRYVTAYKE